MYSGEAGEGTAVGCVSSVHPGDGCRAQIEALCAAPFAASFCYQLSKPSLVVRRASPEDEKLRAVSESNILLAERSFADRWGVVNLSCSLGQVL